VVSGWTLKYFQLGISGALTGEEVDTTEVWNAFLQSPGQVIFFQFIVVLLVLGAIWKGAKAIEKVNFYLMISLFALLFLTLFLSLWMDASDGTLDGALFMFTIDFDMLFEPEVWINGLSQSAWSCSAGMGMCITYAVYMRKDEDTVLNAFTMGLANNSISIIAGLAVLSAIFAVNPDPLATVTGGSSAITFLALPEVFAQAPGGAIGPLFMMAGFFLALSFAAITSMISTVELCVRNFVDHGYDRERSVLITGIAIFLFGLPSAVMWIKLDDAGVAFPEFLEVQDHIWGYGLMFSGLFIAFSIWKYGYIKWRKQVDDGTAPDGLAGYMGIGVSAFRDDFINTGDNDLEVGRWWDVMIYLAFPVLFVVLMGSYFADMIANTENVWDPSNPKGLSIILLFWGVVAVTFMFLNKFLIARPLFRNIPEGADVDISTLPGGDDDLVFALGDVVPGFEHLATKEPVLEAEITG
jgi:NSS family neurotransmitter:Na+ symporter